MPYLGTKGLKASDIRRFNVTGSTSATHTLTWVAPTEQSLIVTINGVKQQEDAYSVSGTTLTLTSALIATDKMEVIGINDVGTTVTPAQNSVNLDKLATTGTASSSTFLRGDMAWTAVSDTSGLASLQTFTSSGTWTKPSGITKVMVEVQGAGAGGNNSLASSSYATTGSAGGYVKKLIDVSSISSATITIGAKGTGSATRVGNDGGDSIWSDGTNTLTAGGGNGSDGSSLTGTAGGSATGGDLNIQGGNGANAAGDAGVSQFGDAGKTYAINATGYGAGGTYEYNTTGGNGSDGIVIVTEYK